MPQLLVHLAAAGKGRARGELQDRCLKDFRHDWGTALGRRELSATLPQNLSVSGLSEWQVGRLLAKRVPPSNHRKLEIRAFCFRFAKAAWISKSLLPSIWIVLSVPANAPAVNPTSPPTIPRAAPTIRAFSPAEKLNHWSGGSSPLRKPIATPDPPPIREPKPRPDRALDFLTILMVLMSVTSMERSVPEEYPKSSIELCFTAINSPFS